MVNKSIIFLCLTLSCCTAIRTQKEEVRNRYVIGIAHNDKGGGKLISKDTI